jgi:S-adenosylmethionine:tRNA ribosyltransferase-isomerase
MTTDNPLIDPQTDSLDSYDFLLPEELIAQNPLPRRTDSKLMIYSHFNKSVEHLNFDEMRTILRPGDCLIINNSKVIPARLWAKKPNSEKWIEFLWMAESIPGVWKGLLRGRHALQTVFSFGNGELRAVLESKNTDGTASLKLLTPVDTLSFLEAFGSVPLPPYIERAKTPQLKDAQDMNRYQTVYAKDSGSIAAPTAGLHFDQALLEELKKMGVEIIPVTLHVGWGTFQPLKEETLRAGVLHPEFFEISKQNADLINACRQSNRRSIVIGTTTARTLESAATTEGTIVPQKSQTTIFIRPPYRFRFVRNLLTNFHLPKSSLLMLIASLIGKEKVLALYKEAIDQKYRFFSYGDAMLILQDS